jgi:hypothetical protein
LNLLHTSKINTSWTKIVSVKQGDKTISFGYKNYTVADDKDFDMAVKVKINSLEFVFLQLLKETLDWVDSLTKAMAAAAVQTSTTSTQSGSTGHVQQAIVPAGPPLRTSSLQSNRLIINNTTPQACLLRFSLEVRQLLFLTLANRPPATCD